MSKTNQTAFSDFSYSVIKSVNPDCCDVKCTFKHNGKTVNHYFAYLKRGDKPNSYYVDKAKADIKSLIDSGKFGEVAKKDFKKGKAKLTPKGKKRLIVGLSVAGALAIAACVTVTVLHFTTNGGDDTSRYIDNAFVIPDTKPINTTTSTLITTAAKNKVSSSLSGVSSRYMTFNDYTIMYPSGNYKNLATRYNNTLKVDARLHSNLVESIKTVSHQDIYQSGVDSSFDSTRQDAIYYVKDSYSSYYNAYDFIKFNYDGYVGQDLKMTQQLYNYYDPSYDGWTDFNVQGQDNARGALKYFFTLTEGATLGIDGDSTDLNYMSMTDDGKDAYLVRETIDTTHQEYSPINPSIVVNYKNVYSYVVHFKYINDTWTAASYAERNLWYADRDYSGNVFNTPKCVQGYKYVNEADYSPLTEYGEYIEPRQDSTNSNYLYMNWYYPDDYTRTPYDFEFSDVSLVEKAINPDFSGSMFVYKNYSHGSDSPFPGGGGSFNPQPAQGNPANGNIDVFHVNNEDEWGPFGAYSPVGLQHEIYDDSYITQIGGYYETYYIYLDKHLVFDFTLWNSDTSDGEDYGYSTVEKVYDPFNAIENDNGFIKVNRSGFYMIKVLLDDNGRILDKGIKMSYVSQDETYSLYYYNSYIFDFDAYTESTGSPDDYAYFEYYKPEGYYERITNWIYDPNLFMEDLLLHHHLGAQNEQFIEAHLNSEDVRAEDYFLPTNGGIEVKVNGIVDSQYVDIFKGNDQSGGDYEDSLTIFVHPSVNPDGILQYEPGKNISLKMTKVLRSNGAHIKGAYEVTYDNGKCLSVDYPLYVDHIDGDLLHNSRTFDYTKTNTFTIYSNYGEMSKKYTGETPELVYWINDDYYTLTENTHFTWNSETSEITILANKIPQEIQGINNYNSWIEVVPPENVRDN